MVQLKIQRGGSDDCPARATRAGFSYDEIYRIIIDGFFGRHDRFALTMSWSIAMDHSKCEARPSSVSWLCPRPSLKSLAII
jgi:hypothetical protein